MSKHECLTITKSMHHSGKSLVETTTYEMLGTTDNGETRLIDIIEMEKIGRKIIWRRQTKRMELPSGKYFSVSPWDDTQRGRYKKIVAEWCALPIKQTYCLQMGTTTGGTRFIKN